MGLESKIKTINGDIRSSSKFVKGSWQSSAEIMKDKIADKSLREEWFYTNNHALYDIEDGDAFLYFGSKDDSIFREKTIKKAFSQLLNGYYKPPVNDVARAKKNSLKVRISELELKFDSNYDIYAYLKIDTSDLNGINLNDTQRKFAEAVYGNMEKNDKDKSNYNKVMKLLNQKNGRIEARIYIVREETVIRNVNKNGAFARACWLTSLGDYSFFYASGRDIGYNSLRGVLKTVAKGDTALKNEPNKESI